MGSLNFRKQARLKRKKRIRKKVVGTQQRPRLCVFRSAKHIYAQVIDDMQGKTLAAASSLEKAVKVSSDINNKKSAANMVGKLVAERALEKGVKTIVFDRNGFLYHGRVKAVSDGAREIGLEF
ncbi:MAG: 50S ribosomal protein L18 [Desulfobacterales bacterium]|jgi:large subunit ribosomal protein L18|nr:MAG: 50S ribosomal protein L18 [Desulfobacterales bacterium]